MKQEMLINVSQPEECRIAIVENGILEELYIERSSQDNYVGNIYKGRVVNIEPSIQAAFVDFGVGRNGFLHISDVEPQYFRQAGLIAENLNHFVAIRSRHLHIEDDQIRFLLTDDRDGLIELPAGHHFPLHPGRWRVH